MSSEAEKLFARMQVAYEQFVQRVKLPPNRLTIHIDLLEALGDKMYEFNSVTGTTWVKRFNDYSYVDVFIRPLMPDEPPYTFSYDHSIHH